MIEYGALTTRPGDSERLFQEQDAEHVDAYRKVATWVTNYLAKESPMKNGQPVCPGIPPSIERSALWFGNCSLNEVQTVAVEEVKPWADRFLQAVPTTEPGCAFKAIILVVVNFTDQQRPYLQRIKNAVKPYFILRGLMVGTFNPEEPDYDPKLDWPPRSPVPILAIRQMIESDHKFLHDHEGIEAYTKRFGKTPAPQNLPRALECPHIHPPKHQ